MSRPVSDRVASLAAGLLLALAHPARALAQQGPPSQTETAAAIAQRNFGLEELHAGHPQRAVEAFERSLAMVESPNTRLDLARALEATSRLARALHEYERARDAAQARADAGRSEYELTARAAAEQAEALRPRVPTLALRFPNGAPPAGTLITVGDASVPAEALVAPLPLDPGHLVVTARGRAVRELRVEREVREGERVELVLPLRAVAIVRVGDASLAPGTTLRLDGRVLEPREAEGDILVDPGPHRLERARGPGLHFEHVDRDVAAGEAVTLEFPHERSRPPAARRRHEPASHAPLLAGVVVGSVGVVAAGVGLGAWLASDATYNALLPQNCGVDPPCTDAQRDARVAGAQSLETAGVALMVGGGVATLVGAGLVLFDRTRGTESPRVSPALGLRSAGVRVTF